MNKTNSKYIVVRKSKIHNNGVFARKDVPKGVRVLQYVGEKINKTEGSKREIIQGKRASKNKKYGVVYVFELDKKWDIDGSFEYNTAKYINHSCSPNCSISIKNGKIWIVSKMTIKKGEKITYNYGYDFEGWQHHKCKCGCANCVGYILDEDEWPKLKKAMKKR